MIYLNTHWQSQLDSAAVRETIPLAEPPIKDFTDVKTDYSRKKYKMQHFFISAAAGIQFSDNSDFYISIFCACNLF